MKRSPLKPVSEKRRKLNVRRQRLLEETFGPSEGWVCFFRSHPGLASAGGCSGDISGHETLKRSRAGSDANLLDMEHIVTLCFLHQVWVEDHPIEAHALGLADHAWERSCGS